MKIGKVIDSNEEFSLEMSKFFKTNTFIQGMTRSGKTNLILKIVEGMTIEKMI